jgi:hypothetical protein
VEGVAAARSPVCSQSLTEAAHDLVSGARHSQGHGNCIERAFEACILHCGHIGETEEVVGAKGSLFDRLIQTGGKLCG